MQANKYRLDNHYFKRQETMRRAVDIKEYHKQGQTNVNRIDLKQTLVSKLHHQAM